MFAAEVPDVLDVAIVGAGVSGIYTAWRLLEEGGASPLLKDLAARRPNRKLLIGVFEYSDRIGGRLYSMRLPGVPSLPIELGGMRFLNSHRRVVGLVDRLNLPNRVLPTEDPRGTNLFYLRGRHFTLADWERPEFVPPYLLDRGERARSPADLLHEVVEKYRFEAPRLGDVGFWNLMLDEMSLEAYQLVREAIGYYSLVNNWSAAEAIPFILKDFAQGLEYRTLAHGFQSLPLALHDRFVTAGGRVALNHRLHRLERDASGAIELIFDVGDPAEFAYYRPPVKQKVHRASHVVLALPQRAIQRLHPDSFVFEDHRFHDAVNAVIAQPAFKIFAAYREPWWERVRGVRAGRSLTDLPVRQCYYWGTEELAESGQSGNSNSILMASYNDGPAVEFWSGLARRSEGYQPPVSACPPGVPIPDGVLNLSASQALVNELQDQLRELHGVSRLSRQDVAPIQPPYVTVYRDWTQEPFGGGWHFWKIGVDSETVSQFMRRPIEGAPLYVCGEAWSRQQGWVEGALETSDEILEHELGLQSPTWLGA